MTIKSLNQTLFFSLVALLLATSAAADPIKVALKSHIETDKEQLTLGDLIDTNATDPSFAETYGRLNLTGISEDTAKIDASNIVTLLAKAGADVENLSLTMSSVTLERGGAIAVDADKQSAIAKVIAKFANIPETDIKVHALRLMPKPFNSDGLAFTAVTISDLSDLSHSRLSVAVKDLAGDETNYNLTAKIEIQTNAVVAGKDLNEGTTLEKNDYHVEMKTLKSLETKIVSPLGIDKKTLKVTHSLWTGDIITEKSVRAAETVAEGALVTLVYNSPLLKASTQGKLLETGEIGTAVSVENLDSKRTITGILTGPDSVEVARAN